MRRGRRRAVDWSAALVGLAIGLAAGTKLNFLLPAAVLVLGLTALAPKGRRWFTLLCAGGMALAGGGYWYLRNLIHSGNPLPWIHHLGPIDLPSPEQALGRPRSPQRLLVPDERLGLVRLVLPRPPRRPLDRLARPRRRRPGRPAPGPDPVALQSHLRITAALVGRKLKPGWSFRPINSGGRQDCGGGVGDRGARGARGGGVVARVADLGLGPGAGCRVGSNPGSAT